MKRLLATLVLCAISTVSAHAQDLGGTYEVYGTNFDGSHYKGTATITIETETTCSIAWQTGGSSSTGICMRNGDSFAAAYSLGKDVGLVIYKMNGDGSLSGLWTLAGQSGVGQEVLTPE